MKARGALAILVCAMAALVLPASAAAKPGYEVKEKSAKLDLFLGERNGYGYSVSAGDGQRVRLVVEKELFSSTAYSVKGRVSSSRIEADFGELGQIDIRVRLNPDSSEPGANGRRRCKGRDPLFTWGGYRGAIEFSGEGAVPAFSSKRGYVRFTRRFRQICKRPSQPKANEGQGKSSIEVGGLRAQAKGEGRTTLFEAFTIAPASSPAESLGFLFGASNERRDRVRIARAAFEIFSLGIVMSKRSKDPQTVRVEPEEAPFAGHALYRRSPGSPAEWTGDLSAKLPGIGSVPFTGPNFTATFCRGFDFGNVESCLKRSGTPAQPSALARRSRDAFALFASAPHGSGSHSQPLALARLSSLR